MEDSLSRYDYHLPEHLIAQHPCQPRHDARLMLLRRRENGAAHHVFKELPNLLPQGALLVANNTRVLPCRLQALLPSGVSIEALLVAEESPGTWTALVRKAKRVKVGMLVPFAGGHLPAKALSRTPEGGWRFAFEQPETLRERLRVHGFAPLPPYIHRDLPTQGGENSQGEDSQADALSTADRTTYQTLYASREGAIAAPTAGLHFTPEVMADLRAKGIGWAEVTLHVGPGTFAKIAVDNPAEHTMHAEYCEVSEQTAQEILAAREAGRPVIAVGTTTVRTLESWAMAGYPGGYSASSNLFIRPPHNFLALDGLITNYHLPKSTLLMLVSAFHGRERILAAYQQAVERDYRFFSYGDCMAILP